MDKEQLLNLIDSLNLPRSEYYILSSGVLVLYGLREKAGDLDLCISPSLFETFKEKFHLTEEQQNCHGFYKLSEDIEFTVSSKENFECTFKDGYPVEKLEIILKFKQKRNAPKDQEDILRIQNFLSQK